MSLALRSVAAGEVRERDIQHRLALLAVVIGVVVVGTIFMPRISYVGDPHAVRLASINLINEGRINVDAATARSYGQRGQWYFENETRGQWFSKYAPMNTLNFLPPLIVERLWLGELQNKLEGYSAQRVLLLNLYNIALSVLVALVLYSICSLYSASHIAKLLFVALTLYSTFMWNYLRAQSFEIFQVLYFLGFYWQALRFKRSFQDTQKVTGRAHLLFATLFVGLLCLTKFVYLLLLPILYPWVCAVLFRYRPNANSSLLSTIRSHARVLTRQLLLPTAVPLLVILYSNDFKFGSPFDTGYTQWVRQTNPFSGDLLSGLHGFLLSSEGSIFNHFPTLILAIFGLRKFARNFRLEFVFGWAIFLLFLMVNAQLFNWKGNWCYGPRYLLFVLPILSLPLLTVLESIIEKPTRPRSLAIATLIVSISLTSGWLQTRVNALDFFANFHHRAIFKQIKPEPGQRRLKKTTVDVQNYFKGQHFGRINNDLIEYRDKGEALYPLELLRRHLSSREIEMIEQALRNGSQSNYFLH